MIISEVAVATVELENDNTGISTPCMALELSQKAIMELVRAELDKVVLISSRRLVSLVSG